jgi:hypothetical protein
MKKYNTEDVFDESKFPEQSFVKIKEYPFIKSALRTSRKHLTISGPSGSGKTTIVHKILKEEGVEESDLLWINAREYERSSSYAELFSVVLKCEAEFQEINKYLKLVKFVVIDDFHFLSGTARFEIARNLKLLHEKGIRFIIIGISSSAEELVGVDSELGIRNDPFELKVQEKEFVFELLANSQKYLNVTFSENSQEQIATASNGIPSVIHLIARICLVSNSIFDTQEKSREIDIALSELKTEILRIFDGKYFNKVVSITKGKQQARSVHNTYFDIISTITKDERSEIPIEYLYERIVKTITDGKERGKKATSFNNCLNNLEDIIERNGLGDLFHYNKTGKTFSIEDPSLRFYLNLLDLDKLKQKVNIRKNGFVYDVAISFAGKDRDTAKELKAAFKERGLEVFYDFDQQAQLWGKELNKTLTDVYLNDSLFMVIIVSKNYPEKDWTNFEFANGKEAKRSTEYLLPIRLDDTNIVGIKDTVGFVDFREQTVDEIADLLMDKVEQHN